MGVGSNIKDFANRKKLSIKELSRRTGIPYNTLYAIIKRDNQKINYSTAIKLANELDVSVDDLFQGTDDELVVRKSPLPVNMLNMVSLFSQVNCEISATEIPNIFCLSNSLGTVIATKDELSYICDTALKMMSITANQFISNRLNGLDESSAKPPTSE